MEEVDERLICSMASLEAHPDHFPFVIRECPGMGLGVFATRDVPAGETLAYDPPLIYWEEDEPEGSPLAKKIIEVCEGRIHTNVVNLLTVYCHADSETRARVDQFMTIDPSAAHHIRSMTEVWQSLADKIWHGVPEIREIVPSRDDIVHLYTRSHLNAHNFYTGHVMLEIGSKFNHACRPNATYNKYKTASGKEYMRIFTIKKIPAGGQIFSTYIGGTDMLKSTRDRRRQLARQKAFVCRCDRCISPDILSPLPCPACGARCLRLDEVEYPWRCDGCGRRWWDSDVTVREAQLRRLITHLDGEMTVGRFPPVQIVRFVVRDALEDLCPGHYLAIQARVLLEEVHHALSFASSTPASEAEGREANCWQIVDFLMSVVWQDVSPVVATNLSVLRIGTLLRSGSVPLGVPRERLCRVLVRARRCLEEFWGPADPDAALCGRALERAGLCEADCGRSWQTGLVVCPRCASAPYCSRACLERHRTEHDEACRAAQETAKVLDSVLAF